MTRPYTHRASRAVANATALAVAVTIALTAGCSAPQPEEPPYDGPPDVVAGIPPDQLPSIAAQLQSSGRTAYYLGPSARGLKLSSLADILATPQFLAAYGTCDPGESGCAEPVTVFTQPWEAEPAGFPCRPLKSQLSVPTLLVRGEVHLYTGRDVVRILDVLDGDPPPGDRADHALALAPQLRPLGAARAMQTLPPPDPEVTTWIEKTCTPASPSRG
jgi:hypothetical protein